MAQLAPEHLEVAGRYLGSAMQAKQDESLNHIAHAFDCEHCQRLAKDRFNLIDRIAKRERKNKKLRKRLKAIRSVSDSDG